MSQKTWLYGDLGDSKRGFKSKIQGTTPVPIGKGKGKGPFGERKNENRGCRWNGLGQGVQKGKNSLRPTEGALPEKCYSGKAIVDTPRHEEDDYMLVNGTGYAYFKMCWHLLRKKNH